jgi:hypothetical protein
VDMAVRRQLVNTGSPDSRPNAELETTVRVLESSTCDFAVMGEEVNGKYYP